MMLSRIRVLIHPSMWPKAIQTLCSGDSSDGQVAPRVSSTVATANAHERGGSPRYTKGQLPMTAMRTPTSRPNVRRSFTGAGVSTLSKISLIKFELRRPTGVWLHRWLHVFPQDEIF